MDPKITVIMNHPEHQSEMLALLLGVFDNPGILQVLSLDGALHHAWQKPDYVVVWPQIVDESQLVAIFKLSQRIREAKIIAVYLDPDGKIGLEECGADGIFEWNQEGDKIENLKRVFDNLKINRETLD